MPLSQVGPNRIEPGTVVRSDDRVLVVREVEFQEEGFFAGKWLHRMRSPTDEERLVSDVMQS